MNIEETKALEFALKVKEERQEKIDKFKTKLMNALDSITEPYIPADTQGLYYLFDHIQRYFYPQERYIDTRQGLAVLIGRDLTGESPAEYLTFILMDRKNGDLTILCFTDEEFEEENNFKCIKYLLEYYQPVQDKILVEDWYFRFKPILYKFLKIDNNEPLS